VEEYKKRTDAIVLETPLQTDFWQFFVIALAPNYLNKGGSEIESHHTNELASFM